MKSNMAASKLLRPGTSTTFKLYTRLICLVVAMIVIVLCTTSRLSSFTHKEFPACEPDITQSTVKDANTTAGNGEPETLSPTKKGRTTPGPGVSHHTGEPSSTGADEVVSPSNRSGVGYMLGLHFSDQGTGASINLMSLLCLSSVVGGVRVVEPFIIGSDIGLNVSANWSQEVKFSDIFDTEKFHSFGKPRGFGSIVPFKKFLEDAPRKLLIAQHKCTGSPVCRTCGHERILKQGHTFSMLNGFEMVGHVCLDYGKKGLMTMQEFTSQLYSRYDKSEVTVIFPIFAGVARGQTTDEEGFRLNITPSKCHRTTIYDTVDYVMPSKLATTSANNYAQKYLKGKPYISVMVRFELIQKGKNNIEEITRSCLSHLLAKITKLKAQFKINNVFLCLDVGKYGSKIINKNETYASLLLPHVNNFISQTVKKGMDLDELDETFTNTTPIRNPGFVAVIQKAIAARGDVLVLLGAWSTFQRSTEKLYNSLHKKRNVVKLGSLCW